MKKAIALMFILILTGCVSSQNQYANRVNSWKGRTIHDLVAGEWGYPDETTMAPNGNALYKYIEKSKTYETRPVYRPLSDRYGTGYVYDRVAVEHQCITFFEADANGVIVNVRWKGDGCW